ncbi:MAG TPA: hypothetical protein EYP34_01645 [Chromatiaceae bacterium]|nr:hypothetical protein [Chromatiaceae bacterium]
MKIPGRRYLLSLFLLILPSLVFASSIKRADMAEIIDEAQLVFEGRVVGKRVEHVPGTRSVHTWVRFEILDLIKGPYEQRFLELSFLGGSAGDLRVEVSDMHIPEMGEQGVYFVEDTGRPLVNPLVGWAQGHFLVQYDKKLQRQMITTLDGKPVFDLESGPMKTRKPEISRGIARGVFTEPQASRAEPLDPARFKALLRGGVQ